jgi:hypothetical protein
MRFLRRHGCAFSAHDPSQPLGHARIERIAQAIAE